MRAGNPDPPIVLVPGFLGRASDWHIDRVQRNHPTARFITTPPGPLSSHHDRACEVFYFLKGGTVDYGETHAASCGHARYGVSYKGKCTEWDADHPLDLVGHSIGGLTARVLQQLLAEQFFPGHDTSASWIRSIVCLSSPLNGDPVVYSLGLRSEDRVAPPAKCSPTSVRASFATSPPRPIAASDASIELCAQCSPSSPPPSPVAPRRGCDAAPQGAAAQLSLLPVRLFSAGWLLTTAAHLLLWLDVRALTAEMQLDHWHLSRKRDAFFTSLSSLLRALAWRGSFGQRCDGARSSPPSTILARARPCIHAFL